MSESPNENIGIVDWLKTASSERRVNQPTDLFNRFVDIERYLLDHIHSDVNQGSGVNAGDRSDGWLTDHGPNHIRTVIQRASELLGHQEEHRLTEYETYILLLAIHFHDVGNIFGREEHEKRIGDVMTELPPTLFKNTTERRLVRDIAAAHGGTVDGVDKDTIGSLPYTLRPLGANSSPEDVRPHLLAAILRLADELADDHTRANRYLIARNEKDNLLRESEAYHLYADRLQRVKPRLENETIELLYVLNIDLAMRQVRKGGRKMFLFDVIRERLGKLHRELVYCSRFMVPYIHFRQVNATIEVCSNDYMDVLRTYSFTMRETGYPPGTANLAHICPELAEVTGKLVRRDITQLTRMRT